MTINKRKVRRRKVSYQNNNKPSCSIYKCSKKNSHKKLPNKSHPHLAVARVTKIKYPGSYVSNGLLPRERCYIISTIQPKSRLEKLKNKAREAILENKIFSISGYAPAVRKALLDRGWIEKIPPERMNLAKIKTGGGLLERLLLSNLLRGNEPNFVWTATDSVNINLSAIPHSVLVNKIQLNSPWTSKQGLSSSLENQHWFYIPDVSEVNYPRTFSLIDKDQLNDFINDYRLTACTNLLKWVLAMVSNKKQITSSVGTIPIALIVFSLNRCKEFLDIKQNKDIDKNIGIIKTNQWDAFLNKYYRIVSKIDLFEDDHANKLPLYLIYAKFLLQEMHKYRPQLNCEGCHNVWIFKPTHSSRGRGIRLVSKLNVISKLLNETNHKYIIQKYIEEPLLIHETKFDIRQYYLVTSTCPLVIWMYEDCYLKYSSQRYNLQSYHESIHLTNNSIQRHYKSGPDRHPNLPKYNMWDLEKFKSYLRGIGMSDVWDNVIYPGMKKSIIGTMLSSQDSVGVSKNRFELYGCDFILDKNFKPWLIEINSRPDLSSTTPVTGSICPNVLSDVIKVVIDHKKNPNAPTGKFTCIYRQSLARIMPVFNGRDPNLSVKGFGLPRDYFYTGETQNNEVYGESNVGESNDFKKILYQLKQAYASQQDKKEPKNLQVKMSELLDYKYDKENNGGVQSGSKSILSNSSFTFKT